MSNTSSGDGGAPTRDARPRRSRPRIRQAGEWWLVLDEDGEAEAWYPTEAEAKAFAEGGGALTEDRPQELTWPSRHDSGVYFGDIEPTAPSPVSEEGPPTRPAMRWDGSRASLDRLCKWVNAGTDADDPLLAYTFYTATDAWDVTLETDSDFEGVEPGDWIVCDETGEFVVCRPGTPEQGEG